MLVSYAGMTRIRFGGQHRWTGALSARFTRAPGIVFWPECRIPARLGHSIRKGRLRAGVARDPDFSMRPEGEGAWPVAVVPIQLNAAGINPQAWWRNPGWSTPWHRRLFPPRTGERDTTMTGNPTTSLLARATTLIHGQPRHARFPGHEDSARSEKLLTHLTFMMNVHWCGWKARASVAR
jgi:hypothetical protein